MPSKDADTEACEKCGTIGAYNADCTLCAIRENITENAEAYRRMGQL